MLLLFLLALFVVSHGYFGGAVFSSGSGSNDQMGQRAVCRLFRDFLRDRRHFVHSAMYMGLRVASERQDNNPDLLYISTLSPGRIIRGKFFCAAYVTLLFFSACLPFMALTNLLRGVDLPTVFFLMAFLFILVCGVNLAAMAFLCLPAHQPAVFKIVAGHWRGSSRFFPASGFDDDGVWK